VTWWCHPRQDRPLYRAYLLKEQLRQIYRLPADAANHAARRMDCVGAPLSAALVR